MRGPGPDLMMTVMVVMGVMLVTSVIRVIGVMIVVVPAAAQDEQRDRCNH